MSAGQTHSTALRFAALVAVFFSVSLLCGCPKKQWHYAPPQAPPPSKDFDAAWDATHLDPNGAAFNVDWAPQRQGRVPNPDACNDGQPYSPACTQNTPFQDQPDGIHEAFCFLGKAFSPSPLQPFFGHADWMVAQYTGAIGWFNYGADSDYDLFLVPGADNLPPAPGNEHGITTNNSFVGDNSANPRFIEMEFDSDETDPAFTQGPWKNFQTSGEANDIAAVQEIFHPGNTNLACASAVGLFGLDCDHGCRSEIHPVYGLAVQRTEDAGNNQWMVMVRNWGTGGYCSQYNDQLDQTSLSLILPYTSSQQPTATLDSWASTADGKGQVSCPKIYFHDGQAVLNVKLPAPGKQSIAAFSMTLQWPAGAHSAACTQVNTSDAAVTIKRELAALAPPTAAEECKGRGEDYMTMLLHGPGEHPAMEKESIRKSLASRNAALNTRLAHMTANRKEKTCEGAIEVINGAPPVPQAKVTALTGLHPDPVKMTRDDNIRAEICRKWDGREPPVGTADQLKEACQGVK